MSEDWKGQVSVFSITGCPHCKAAKALLKELGTPYVEMDVTASKKGRLWLSNRTGKRTVPQIFLNDQHVGGNSELQELHKKGELLGMLHAVKDTPVPDGTPKLPEIIDDPLEDNPQMDDLTMTCEPDLQGSIVVSMRMPKAEGGLDIADRRHHLVLYNKCFTGKAFVEWMIMHKDITKCATVEDALRVGNEMMKGNLFDHVKSDHTLENEDFFYRFAEDSPDGHKALNLPIKGEVSCQPAGAGELGKALRTLILKIYDEFLSADGRTVDYEGIAKSPNFQHYRELTVRLMRVDLNVSHEEKLAFLINVYNALVIHKTVVEGKPTSTWKRFKFFTKPGYIIAGHAYSLNDIENGLIRTNKSPPMSSSLQFSKHDPRLQFCLQRLDPRIHFALVCGAQSCPPIKTYDASNVDEALTGAAQAFFEGDGIILDEKKNEASITRICKWYRSDFGGYDDADLVGWISSFLEGEKREVCTRILDRNKVRVKFQVYNWDSNSKK